MPLPADKKYTLLYVDDEEHNLNSFRAAFRRYYNILSASSAKEGIEILNTHEIHLLITDQRMPEMTGVQFLESCVKDYPEMIRMILTGFSDVQDIIEAINTGRVYRYITKPWDENELKITIDRALESYELRIKNSLLLQEARENELKFRSIIANSTDIISILNPEGNYSFNSPSVKELLGYMPDELEGKSAFDFIHPEDLHIVKSTFQSALTSPGTTHASEFRYRKKDGNWVYLESRGSFQTRDGKLEGIVNSRETTERRRSEELQREKEIAMESGKLKERFLANMSHEIRTPMNAVMGITNLMLKTPLNDTQHKYISAIKKSSENLLVIINDILDFSKIEAGKIDFENIDFRLQDLLDGVMDILRFKAEEKGLVLKYFLDEKLPPFLKGDPVRLTQILLNLSGNAIKFTEKGSVSIHCTIKDSTHVEFSVTDTGIGIPEEKMEKIFDSFSQASADTTRKFGGTGLGLTISKQLVELQGGNISVKSVFGKGTVFTFSIPYKPGTGEINENESLTISHEHLEELRKIRVLLAEDNEFNRLVAISVLQSAVEGIQVDVAENGQIAIDKHEKESYDIILMDMQMPVMSGYEASEYIRNKMPALLSQVPIIALTANVSQADIDKCRNAGMNDFLSKPFKEYDLLTKMYTLVSKSPMPKSVKSATAKPASSSSEKRNERFTNLETLISLSKGNKKYVKDMIELFIQQTASSIEIIKKGIAENDFQKIGGIAHRMRPSFGFMGIKGMDVLTKEIEELATGETNNSPVSGREKIPTLCNTLENVCNKALEELKGELPKYN